MSISINIKVNDHTAYVLYLSSIIKNDMNLNFRQRII